MKSSSTLIIHHSALRVLHLLLRCLFVFVEAVSTSAVELGGGEAYRQRLRRVCEGERAAARGLDFCDERVLPLPEAHDRAALVEYDEEQRRAVTHAHLSDERARAAVRATERAGLRDDASAVRLVRVT